MSKTIHSAVRLPDRAGTRIELTADRQMLAKRRWRGVAEDGTEFGFDLSEPLRDGAVILESEVSHYVLRQAAEPVLEIALEEAPVAARIAWALGNLRLPIELEQNVLRVMDDPQVRLYLEREKIAYGIAARVFRPIKGTPSTHANG